MREFRVESDSASKKKGIKKLQSREILLEMKGKILTRKKSRFSKQVVIEFEPSQVDSHKNKSSLRRTLSHPRNKFVTFHWRQELNV